MELLKPEGKKITLVAGWPNNFGSATVEIDCVITDCEFKGEDVEWDFKAVGFGSGYMCYTAVIEAGNLQDALDEWADSDMAFLTEVEDEDEEEWHTHAGNFGKRHDFQDIRFVADLTYDQVKAALL